MYRFQPPPWEHRLKSAPRASRAPPSSEIGGGLVPRLVQGSGLRDPPFQLAAPSNPLLHPHAPPLPPRPAKFQPPPLSGKDGGGLVGRLGGGQCLGFGVVGFRIGGWGCGVWGVGCGVWGLGSGLRRSAASLWRRARSTRACCARAKTMLGDVDQAAGEQI